MVDISTTYLGLKLKSPIVASSSPLLKKVADVQRMEEAGVGAVVLYSLFEEQIVHESFELDHHLNRSVNLSPEGLGYIPDSGTYSLLPDKYLENIQTLKKAVKLPIIGSLNGATNGGWVRYARFIEDAGADALELNMYYLATDPASSAVDIENEQIDLVADVRASTKLPLTIKLSPYYTALPHFLHRLVDAGANGLVLFNRFYQPDFDIEELEVMHTLDLSTSAELRLPLRWISILHGSVNADFALTSGVHTYVDVLKTMMAGASVAMMASELLHNGIGRIQEILKDMESWMVDHEYQSITDMQGSMSQKSVPNPAAFERVNYMKVLNSFNDLP
jgi:dihydroorotate dehydrogenase (fumarate)